MTEKRFKLIYNEYQTSNGKTIKAEPYFIDTKEEYVDEVYFTIKGSPTMSDEQVVDLLNEQEETIERLKTIREEQIEVILKQKEKIKELTTQLQTEEESVCTKCKHQYLIKHPLESSKYYISKCIKEHNECSKEDIRYCEDFELTGDDYDE